MNKVHSLKSKLTTNIILFCYRKQLMHRKRYNSYYYYYNYYNYYYYYYYYYYLTPTFCYVYAVTLLSNFSLTSLNPQNKNT